MTPENEGTLSVQREIDVSTSAGQVWDLLGDYNAIEDWHPAVVSSTLTGDGETAGSRRVLSLPGDVKIIEDLVSHNNDDMSYSYQIIEGPFPITDYESTIRVEYAGNESSKVIWSSTFKASGVSDKEAIGIITGVYEAGLDSIQQRF